MRFAIAYGKDNIAGTNIVKQFKELAYAPQIPIIELKKDSIYADDLSAKNYPELKQVDLIVFASTHRSEKGDPSLSLHAPGNWRSADLGGKQGKVSMTSAFVLKYLFQQLNKIADENKKDIKDYYVTLEVTHHGPSIDIPCIFIEVGSSETQWKDIVACKIIAKTILTLQNFNFVNTSLWIPAIGIGGPHYAPIFNQIQLNSEYALSHIIPQYSLPLTESMLSEAEQKTKEQVKQVLVDWKGCGNSEQRQDVIKVIENSGLKYKRTSDVEK